MLATFDPVIQEHVRRIQSSEIHDHYLGTNIHNELIKLLSEKIKSKNVADIKVAKYFSVMLDCTPDLIHTKQLSLVLRFVRTDMNASSLESENEGLSIEEYFLGLSVIKSTAGKNLSDFLQQELDDLDCKLGKAGNKDMTTVLI
ncbi:uncharacterized protein LOC136086204 [Hydra vulgaris]|uniref:Uncharacterized protein LOC136086204 n=1 Tax=Hydra vulgaris TaxID=6087 RepID=A0ABM4CRQ3_HYDVU